MSCRPISGRPMEKKAFAPQTAAWVVLPAVLSDAGRIAADIADLLPGFVKRGRKQPENAVRAVEQLFIGGKHRPLGLGRSAHRHRCEGLRQQVDFTFLIARHADGRAVVTEGAGVAVAAEGVLVERTEQPFGQRAVVGNGFLVAEVRHHGLKRPQRENKEKADEHAFASTLDAHCGERVVPVAGPDAAEPVRTELLGIRQRAHAVQIQVFAQRAAAGCSYRSFSPSRSGSDTR